LKTALNWAMEERSGAAASVRPLWIGATAMLAVAVAIAASALWTRRPHPARETATRFTLDPPEGGRFHPASIAVSRDGRSIAFVAVTKGKSELWFRSLDAMAAQRLPGTEGATYPFFSPDGRSLAFFAASKLWRVDVTGSKPLPICDAPLGRGGAWSDDGTILFAKLTSPLQRVSASGGTPALLTKPDYSRGEVSLVWPQIVPGGRYLYFVLSGKQEYNGIFASSFANPERRDRILLSWRSNAIYSAGHLLWMSGTMLVAQRFDPYRMTFSGEPFTVADEVGRAIGISRMLIAAASGGELLLYSNDASKNQFTVVRSCG